MKKTELATLSLKQLVALQADITPLIEAKRKEEHAALREKLAKMAADADFRLEAILEDQHTKRRTRRLPSAPVKYRDPANHENTWSGRGRPARWLTAYVKAGKKMESFRVDA